MSQQKFSSFYTIYKLSLELAAEHEGVFKRSLLYFIIAFIAQGLAFAMFYPLLQSMFAQNFIVDDVLLYLGVMFLFSAISFVAKWKGHEFDYSGGTVDITHDLRTRLGTALREMPLEQLSKYKTGELNSILSSNVDESVLHMGMVASMLLQIVIVPLTIIIVTFFIDYRLALVMLCMLPLTIPLYIWKRTGSAKEKKEFNEVNAELEADFVEYIQGLPVLRAVNQVGINAKKLQDSIKEVKTVQQKGLYSGQLPFVLMGVLVEIIVLTMVFVGAYFVLDDTLSFVVLAAATLVVSKLAEPLYIFLGIVSVFDLMDSAFKRIKSIFAVPTLEVIKPLKTVTEQFDIEFSDLTFAYESQDESALKNMNFHMQNKSMTAIVGHSGCGKTTITKMIMRYADPQKGSVKIGGVDIKEMTQTELMKNISVVFQDVYLFDDTIMNNIRMADPSASDEEVKQAAKSAYCHEFIARLPDGYHTQIGDIGGSLSGGERQRISIARAILKNAPIVILDEPTAALDTESEVAVQSAIDKLVEDKTVVVIAHRLSTIAAADKILVVDDGRVIQQGTHDELVALSGRYHSMWSAQQRIKEWHIDA